MRVKQISVFLENKVGRLSEVTRTLGEEGINIRALSIADTTEFGILRMIVDKPDSAYKVLKDKGFATSMTDVLAVEVEDKPGGLAKVLEVLKEAGINVEYVYAFVTPSGKNALVVIRVEKMEEGEKVLTNAGVKLLPPEEVYAL